MRKLPGALPRRAMRSPRSASIMIFACRTTTWNKQDARRRLLSPPRAAAACGAAVKWTNFWHRLEGRTEMTMQTKAPESQFAYVVLAARRARQIMAGAPPLLDNLRTQKATRIACDELEHGLLEFDVPERAEGDEDKDESKRKK